MHSNTVHASSKNTSKIFDTIVDCIDYIYEGDEVYKSKDSSKAELTDFFNNLNTCLLYTSDAADE